MLEALEEERWDNDIAVFLEAGRLLPSEVSAIARRIENKINRWTVAEIDALSRSVINFGPELLPEDVPAFVLAAVRKALGQ